MTEIVGLKVLFVAGVGPPVRDLREAYDLPDQSIPRRAVRKP
jgi:hypothetical protein